MHKLSSHHDCFTLLGCNVLYNTAELTTVLAVTSEEYANATKY